MAKIDMNISQALSMAILLCELEATACPGRPERSEFGQAAQALRMLKRGNVYISAAANPPTISKKRGND